jgi:hypothetical protein
MDNKYKNAKIYTIRNRNDETLIYVGSTVQPLYKRLSQHKTDSKNPKCENYLLYKKINETDINNFYIELYEDFPCERKEQLLQREGQVIREIGTLNKFIPGRTHKEWIEENKENKENKEKIKENKKEYGSEYIFCECGCSTRRDGISKHKQTLKHLDIMKELAKTLEQTI